MALTRRHFTGLALTLTGAAALGAAPSLAGSAKERTGSLSGRRGYNVSGTVRVQKTGGKTKVMLGGDFLFDPTKNPPDIKIGFGSNETYAKGSKIHDALKVNAADARFHKTGAATFEVPAGIDTDAYSELYIYCEQFSVILAVAPLN